MRADNRNIIIKRNIIASFFIKGWSAGVQMLLVPMTLVYLGSYINGLWMTIASVLAWIDNLDIGLGNGLRNKLTESLAKGYNEESQQYVTTAFASLVVVMALVAIVISVLVLCIDIDNFLKIDSSCVSSFSYILVMSFVITCITFIFKLTGNVYLALQLPAVNNAIVAFGQTLTLLFVFSISLFEKHDLILVALAYTLAPLVVYFVIFLYTFLYKYKSLCPRFSSFKGNLVKPLMTLGVKFFILQIAGIILFMSSNIIVSHLYSPDAVTTYQIAYRLFSLVLVIVLLVITPYWSATTDAYKHGDIQWIRASQKKMHKVMIATFIALSVMVLLSDKLYYIWVGGSVSVPFTLSLLMGIYIFEILLSQSYSFMLNGMGILKLQLILTVLAAITFVPLALSLGDYLGMSGVCLSLIIANLPGTVANIVQFNCVVNKIDNQHVSK